MSASSTKIYFLLQRAAHRLKTEADASLTETSGLTTAQAAVMSIIAKDGPITQKHIAETLSQRESAVTAMVARLVKSGYITKSRSTSDARAWQLNATDTGRLALTHVQAAFGKINAALDERIASEEMDRLSESLVKILAAFENYPAGS